MINYDNIIQLALNIELESLINDLKKKHIELGQPATRQWLEQLRYELNGTFAKVIGMEYTKQLENGRAGGSMPPIAPLETWVKAKLGKTGKEARSVAFAVAKKIEKEGTNIYPKGTDLIDGVITDQRIEQIIINVGNYLNEIIIEDIQLTIQKTLSNVR